MRKPCSLACLSCLISSCTPISVSMLLAALLDEDEDTPKRPINCPRKNEEAARKRKEEQGLCGTISSYGSNNADAHMDLVRPPLLQKSSNTLEHHDYGLGSQAAGCWLLDNLINSKPNVLWRHVVKRQEEGDLGFAWKMI